MITSLILALAPISVSSLLAEMDDLDRLMEPASYAMAQASSYDRASKSPQEEWFANADAGKFVRDEGNERVMADLRGPGAVVRIWSANPTGTIRFYVDGESTARLVAPMGDLLRGKHQPFGEPFGYESARGCNLYFPIPYAKSLKVTAEGPVQGLYYHVGYRTYPANQAVESFDPSRLPDVRAFRIAPRSEAPGSTGNANARLARGGKLFLNISGPSVVREFKANVGKMDATSLRSLVLTMVVDGQTTINAPLGDFFATAPGVRKLSSLPMEVSEDGTLVCRFPMPVGKSARIEVQNTGRIAVPLSISVRAAGVAKVPAYRFHAQWSYERGRTRPMRDMAFLDAKGQGRFVGAFLHVENPTPAWWGEGDEKIYVDGEVFPSTFGTGTEDYFGYAWCWPDLFIRPYHGQPRCDGPGNFGHTAVFRWQTFDDIPFTKSLKFDMEMWHWADVDATWARTAYWYAAPGGTGNSPIRSHAPIKLEGPKPVAGAIEGEGLEVVSASGGKHEVQEGFWEISGQKQRWWMDAAAGDKLVLKLPVATTGRYEITANLCHAKDYGIHEIAVNGKKIREIDFYSDGLGWKKHVLGVFELKSPSATLEVVCNGNNAKAIARRMFGLDYLLVKRQ